MHRKIIGGKPAFLVLVFGHEEKKEGGGDLHRVIQILECGHAREEFVEFTHCGCYGGAKTLVAFISERSKLGHFR